MPRGRGFAAATTSATFFPHFEQRMARMDELRTVVGHFLSDFALFETLHLTAALSTLPHPRWREGRMFGRYPTNSGSGVPNGAPGSGKRGCDGVRFPIEL
jgi:hypothetical protein